MTTVWPAASRWNRPGRRRHRMRPGPRLGEFLRVEQGAPRRAGRNRGEGTASKWTEAVLHSQSAEGEEPPFIEVAPRDLADRKRLYDLGAIVARILRLSLSHTRCFARQVIHTL